MKTQQLQAIKANIDHAMMLSGGYPKGPCFIGSEKHIEQLAAINNNLMPEMIQYLENLKNIADSHMILTTGQIDNINSLLKRAKQGGAE